jgi:serine/threonine protein kinase
MEIYKTSSSIYSIEKEGKKYSGFGTGIAVGNFATTRLAQASKENGIILKDDRIDPWKFSGITQHEDEVLIYCPEFEGRCLSDILKLPMLEALGYIRDLASALSLLSAKGYPVEDIHTDGIFFLSDGRILFFPTGFLQVLAMNQVKDDRLRFFELYNHPDLKGGDNLSFALGVMVYLLLTGAHPFFADSEEEVHTLMREKSVLPPHLLNPVLRPEVSQAVIDSLSGKVNSEKANPFSLSDWNKYLTLWEGNGIEKEISGEERSLLEKQRSMAEEKSNRSYSRKVFLRKYGRRVTLIAIGTIIAGVLIGSFLSNALAPRSTAGFTPEQVVTTYYTSINSLDHIRMEDCVTGNAGKDEIKALLNLYVITRVKSAYENDSGFIPADLWVNDGQPELQPGVTVYGVADLYISLEKSGDEEFIFKAEYEKWVPATPEDDSETDFDSDPKPLRPLGEKRIERLYLTRDKKDWVIYKIDIVESTPL